MIRTVALPGQESESLNSQFLVDSMRAMIHTDGPDGYLDYFNKRWLEYLGVIMYDVSQWKCRAFVHREVGENRWKLHCKMPLCDRRGNNFHVKDLVNRIRANDRTHAVTNCDLARAPKFDSLWPRSVETRSVPRP